MTARPAPLSRPEEMAQNLEKVKSAIAAAREFSEREKVGYIGQRIVDIVERSNSDPDTLKGAIAAARAFSEREQVGNIGQRIVDIIERGM